ncbi:MAG TPA: flavodoxin domain-containing protein [Candidatus Binatus sp.]|nr:flavodoxin domain-containing protein [Candidatus Binatus sp.]
MPRALIVHASRHGATAGIAERIAEVLRSQGIEAVVAPAARAPDPFGFNACVVGAGVYLGSWVRDGTDYLERYQATLAAVPTWLFSSGPLPGSTKQSAGLDALSLALGPSDGPGSGGRRKVEGLADIIGARDHAVFEGAFDPNGQPRTMSERVLRLLPAGDFRPWDRIDGWARVIAAAIRGPVPVG